MSVTTSNHEASLPSPPFITISGIPNFRDLGGYPVASSSSHSIRRGLIYRCGEPSNVTPEGIKTMQGLGITHVYDLRSLPELQRNKDAGRGDVVEWEGCERVFVPVFHDKDYSPEALAVRFRDYASNDSEGFTRAYTNILDNAPSAYRSILLHIANEPQQPIIVHCTAGKDRTGVFCAIILSLCGVDDEIVAQEYGLTEIGLPDSWKEGVIQHLMDIPILKDNPEGARNLIGAKASSMRSTLRALKKDYGGAEGYVIEKCGLTKEEVENIRANLIVEAPGVHQKVQQSL